jgi:hypothetical protein
LANLTSLWSKLCMEIVAYPSFGIILCVLQKAKNRLAVCFSGCVLWGQRAQVAETVRVEEGMVQDRSQCLT